KTLPKAHYVVFMLYRSQISGNSRKDRSVTEYDKKPYLL
ncbi:RNA polymerase sigma factor, partial [Phocaeicola vulgatus]